MVKKIGIDELLNATSHKRIKEYMRTDKPSRRKLYIEIYEFKDKEAIKKLPCKKEQKTDEAKEGIVEFDVTSKEIIQMTLKPLGKVMVSITRMKQYCMDFNVSIGDIQALMKNGLYRIYGHAVSENIESDFERWYLIVLRDGSIMGFFNVAWSSQVDKQNRVLKWGGDITTVGVKDEAEMEKIMNVLFEREEFKKLPMINICRDYGKSKLKENWIYIDYRNQYIPLTVFEKLNGNGVSVYFNAPPFNEFGKPEVEAAWITGFKTNYELKWKRARNVDITGLTTEEALAKQMEDKKLMDASINDELSRELQHRRTTYDSALNRWKIQQEETISNYGQNLTDESVYGVVYGLSRHRRENVHEEEDNSNDNPCEGCEEYATAYCRNDCDNSPCRHCDSDCDTCDVAGNG